MSLDHSVRVNIKRFHGRGALHKWGDETCEPRSCDECHALTATMTFMRCYLCTQCALDDKHWYNIATTLRALPDINAFLAAPVADVCPNADASGIYGMVCPCLVNLNLFHTKKKIERMTE